MGLFNRNKADAAASSTPTTPATGTPPADNSFDFDAISRDLDAQNGASSFDSLLAAPVNNAQQKPTAEANAFPDNDPLGLSTPAATNAAPFATTGTAPIASSPEAVINAPIAPSTSPTTGVAPVGARPSVPSPAPSNVPVAKKSFPVVPLLGALGILAIAGGGAMFLLNSNQESEAPIPVAPKPAVGQSSSSPLTPPAPGTAPIPGGAPGTVGAPPPGASVPAGAPIVPGTSGGPAPAPGLRSASPGIAPPAAPRRPVPAPNSSSNVSITVGQSGAGRGPSATAGLDPDLASKLKALWRAGADAKRRRDYPAARTAWQEALRLRPGHPGFQESIDKLPR